MYDLNTCVYLYHVFFLHLYMHSILFIAPISICFTRGKEGVLLHWLGLFVSLHQHQTPVQSYIYQPASHQTPVQPYIYQSASTRYTCPTLHLSVCINTRHRHLSNPTFISLHQHQTYIYQSASTPDTCPTLQLSVCINTRHLSNHTVTIASTSDTCLTLHLSAGVMREN